MPNSAFSYNPTLADDLSMVRFIIGDTDEDRLLFDDREIRAALDLKDDTYRACIFLLEGLESRYTRLSEARAGDIIANMNDIMSKISRKLRILRKRGVKGFALIYTADRQSDKQNDAIVHPSVGLGDFDNNAG